MASCKKRMPVSTSHEFRWNQLAGVLFDLDGVITPTADVHERAWAAVFADFDYRHQDYLDHIDGKPRLAGVADFLTSRGVTLPTGSPSAAPGTDSVAAFGNRKNATFLDILNSEGIQAFPGSLSTLDHLDAISVPYAIVSSSRNADAVLMAAGIRDRFDIVIDGLTTLQRGLPGKPDPAGYLAGAAELQIDPAATAVVEDAVSGVTAGARGGFAPVIGVDRTGNSDELLRVGASFVVEDLSELLPARSI